MKKILLSVIAIIIASSSNAQWTTSGSNIYNSNTGNVGIGTTSPGDWFDVHITTNSTGITVSAPNNSGNGSQPTLSFKRYNSGTISSVAKILSGVYATNGDLLFQTSVGSSIYNSMYISSAGNVGIATINPISLFQVDGGASKTAIGDASGLNLNYGTSYLDFNAARSGTNWTLNTDGSNNGGGVIYSTIFGDLYFSNIGSTGTSDQTLTDAQIKSKINLRISPDGITHAKQIIVETSNWPDYVFSQPISYLPC